MRCWSFLRCSVFRSRPRMSTNPRLRPQLLGPKTARGASCRPLARHSAASPDHPVREHPRRPLAQVFASASSSRVCKFRKQQTDQSTGRTGWTPSQRSARRPVMRGGRGTKRTSAPAVGALVCLRWRSFVVVIAVLDRTTAGCDSSVELTRVTSVVSHRYRYAHPPVLGATSLLSKMSLIWESRSKNSAGEST